MKIVAFTCNVVLFVFTCILLLFEGMSGEAVYIILSLLMLLVPVLNMVVISASWGWFGIGNKSEASQQQKKAGMIQSSASMSFIKRSIVLSITTGGLRIRGSINNSLNSGCFYMFQVPGSTYPTNLEP